MLVSVIIPVYNGEEYIQYCLDSIRKQSHPDLEILVIDDGSTDYTLERCGQIADERIKIYKQDNQGVSAARNYGLRMAKGEAITFVDTDDWIRQDMIERMVDVLLKEKADMVGCEYESCTEHTTMHTNETDASICYSREQYIEECLLKGNTRCWSKLYKRDILQDIWFSTELTIGEDLLFLADVSSKAQKIVSLSYKGYYYYNNLNGAMQQRFIPAYMDQITCWKKTWEVISNYTPHLKSQLTGNLLMGILLTVGKLAVRMDKEEQQRYLKICHSELKEALREKRALRYVYPGYPIKIMLFYLFPSLYVRAYGAWKQS